MIAQGEVWWADLGAPRGSGAALRRPVVVVQADALNHSRISTVVCVPLTSNLKWAKAPGNVLLRSKATHLPKASVANVSLVVAIDKTQLMERVGKISMRQLEQIFAGIDVLLGR